MNPNKTDKKNYDELSYYTLAHPDPKFIHQHIVDAYAAQHADENTKPITLAFALVGLYLYLEKNYTGKETQKAHMLLARKRKDWPRFKRPQGRGTFTVADVLKFPPGPARDEAIRNWCASVWGAYEKVHEEVKESMQTELK